VPPFPALVRQVAGAMKSGLTDPRTDASRKLLVLSGFLASGLSLAQSTAGTLASVATKIEVLGPAQRPQALSQLR
jgi:hypothetical protein